eukprot:SAG31_NODE_6276_length_2092_cov_6.520321_2_plen_185_part_00
MVSPCRAGPGDSIEGSYGMPCRVVPPPRPPAPRGAAASSDNSAISFGTSPPRHRPRADQRPAPLPRASRGVHWTALDRLWAPFSPPRPLRGRVAEAPERRVLRCFERLWRHARHAHRHRAEGHLRRAPLPRVSRGGQWTAQNRLWARMERKAVDGAAAKERAALWQPGWPASRRIDNTAPKKLL